MELERAIGRLEGTMTAVEAKLDVVVVKVDELVNWKWKLYGMSVVITIITGALFEIAIAFIKHE